jgi:dihydroorotase
MANNYLLKNATITTGGRTFTADVRISGAYIEQIDNCLTAQPHETVLDLAGKYLLPGLVDDQVHFREPGLTHKGDIYTESRAAVAGGITTYMEMPNTVPQATTLELLEEKYTAAAKKSLANYSFYLGGTNTNLDVIKQLDPKKICGLKVFMGSSTGNMLVDEPEVLESIFRESPSIIATHCEDTPTIKQNEADYLQKYGQEVPLNKHPEIRSAEACYLSSSMAIDLAKRTNARLHVLHLSTARELTQFEKNVPLKEKRITAEACTHHLWFTAKDYEKKGTYIKWNPAVKYEADRAAIRQAVIDGAIDVLATDHAPHTIEEKQNSYFNAPSGGPLVQHSLLALLELVKEGIFTKELIVEKACHNPAILFDVEKRGFIEEGYYADLVVVDPEQQTNAADNLLYKCGWTPFKGTTFSHRIIQTFVNGHLAYNNGKLNDSFLGKRITFTR